MKESWFITRGKKGQSMLRTVLLIGIIGVFAAVGMYAVKMALLKQHVSGTVDLTGAVANSPQTRCKMLSDYCIDSSDRILACDFANLSVKILSLDDKLIDEYILAFRPEVIECMPDNRIVVAGQGKASVINPDDGNIFSADIPGTMSTSIAACDDTIFITVRESTSYSIYKMNQKLEDQERIITGLRGCCGQFDITAADGVVYAAANCLFKVVKYDFEGKEISSFGQKGRGEEGKFNGCCEPKNICFDPDGNLLVSESADCCVKRFTKDGRFLGLVGTVNGISGCVRVSLGVTRDGSKIYMLDTERNLVRLVN